VIRHIDRTVVDNKNSTVEMEIISKVKNLIAKGKVPHALSILRSSRGIFDNTIIDKFHLLSERYFRLQSNFDLDKIKQDEKNVELNKISQAVINILNDEMFDEPAYQQNENKYEQVILDLGENYKSISRTARNATRIRKKYEIVKFIAEKLIEYPALVSKFQDSKDQAVIGGIAYKIKVDPSVEDLEILKKISKNCESNYVRGQVVNAIGEIIYTAELRIGDDDEIKELLRTIKDEEDIPLTKNIEGVNAALDFLLLYGKDK